MLAGRTVSKFEHQDLWRPLADALQARPGNFKATHVPAHTGTQGVEAGKISAIYQFLDDGADKEAVAGAQENSLPDVLRLAALKRQHSAVVVHYTAAMILDAR